MRRNDRRLLLNLDVQGVNTAAGPCLNLIGRDASRELLTERDMVKLRATEFPQSRAMFEELTSRNFERASVSFCPVRQNVDGSRCRNDGRHGDGVSIDTGCVRNFIATQRHGYYPVLLDEFFNNTFVKSFECPDVSRHNCAAYVQFLQQAGTRNLKLALNARYGRRS